MKSRQDVNGGIGRGGETKGRTDGEADREMEEPVLVHPHDDAERAEVPLYLLAHVRLLDLDGDPLLRAVVRPKLGAVHLGDACARGGFLLEDLENAIRARRRTAELRPEDGFYGRIGNLWCVVEEAAELFLHGLREKCGVVRKSLP